jgi:hypothetical protein
VILPTEGVKGGPQAMRALCTKPRADGQEGVRINGCCSPWLWALATLDQLKTMQEKSYKQKYQKHTSL